MHTNSTYCMLPGCIFPREVTACHLRSATHSYENDRGHGNFPKYFLGAQGRTRVKLSWLDKL